MVVQRNVPALLLTLNTTGITSPVVRARSLATATIGVVAQGQGPGGAGGDGGAGGF